MAGQFQGSVVVEWISGDGPDRDMRLREPFTYVDSAGKVWRVPAGAVVNGASIPRVLWNTVGPPFVGDYRRASVVHDYFCDDRTEPWQAVHRMFYEGCLTGGVSETRAKLMYAAVYAAGPRWSDPGGRSLRRPGGADDSGLEQLGADKPVQRALHDEKLRELGAWIESANPSLEEIEERMESGSQMP